MIAFTRMLDTNIVSNLVRNPGGKAAQRLALEGEDTICVSIIAAAELRFGVAKRGSQRLATQLDRVLATMNVMPFEAPADQVYGLVRKTLELAGTPISANDLLIAAHVLALQLTLVSHNTGEFRRVPGLAVEDWLE